jgi:hypothetical protein
MNSRLEPGDVKRGVAQERQLSFLRDVPFVSKTPDEAQRMMIARLERDNDDAELRYSGEAGQMTGLFPPGIDLKLEEIKLMRDQVAGFYDPHTKVMVEVRGMGVLGSGFSGDNSPKGELLYAHELTHALQDQHFGLEPMMERAKNDDDEEIALHAVMEGDATLCGLAYVSGGLDNESLDRILAQLSALDTDAYSEAQGAPIGLRVPMLFQYSQGARFVAEAWKRGGWNAVDALYRDPPQSSQQILDPSLYFDHRTPPRRIVLGGYEDTLTGWKKVEDDTFGELLLQIILERNLPPHAQELHLAERWAGDQMVILQKDNAVTLIWMVVFRDRFSARAFATTYDRILTHLKGVTYVHAFGIREDAVLIAIGAAADNFATLAPKVWQATTILSPCPPLPLPGVDTGCPVPAAPAGLLAAHR